MNEQKNFVQNEYKLNITKVWRKKANKILTAERTDIKHTAKQLRGERTVCFEICDCFIRIAA